MYTPNEKDIKEAILIIDNFEYSSDGDVKRYPSQQEYDWAVLVLKSFFTLRSAK